VLRLWESRASDFFNWDVFNNGGYIDAARENIEAETISKVLYPNDETEAGKELRLIQQYFFVSSSLKDIIRRMGASNITRRTEAQPTLMRQVGLNNAPIR